MKNMKMSGLMIVAIAAIALAACGDDDASNNTAANNATTNNATTNNATTNNATTNNATTNNATTNNATTPIPDPAPPTCADDPAPERCTASPEGFEYGIGSVITEFEVAAGGDCCFDYTGDEVPDNLLGTILSGAGEIESINDSIAEGIADGSIVIAMEHEGLDPAAGGDFVINFWLGQWGLDADMVPITMLDLMGGNPILIDPASIDEGTQPLAYLPTANLSDGAVVAGPGVFQIAIDVLGTPLNLRISGTRIEADVDADNTSAEAGVALTNGRLGGYTTSEDLLGAINGFAATCECLAIGQDPLVSSEGTCNENVDIAACTDAGESTCASLAEQCGLLRSVVTLGDVDTDGVGGPDAISIGATFSASGAVFQGVAEEAPQ